MRRTVTKWIMLKVVYVGMKEKRLVVKRKVKVNKVTYLGYNTRV